ncbi:MAG: metallophosphoesterase [Acidobacteria bacterium]|nr:MAG: metallophosphoesterase [Acidobacteriota bacterium]
MLVTRRAALKTLMAGSVGTVIGGAAYGLAYSRHQIQVLRGTVPVAGLSPALDGLRVGLITDLHHSEMVPASDVARAASLIRAERPDVIVLGGDYVTWGDRHYVVPCSEALAGLTAPFGVYGVLGNHDDDRDMPAALAAHGYEVLRDARTTVRIRGEKIDLVGVRYWTRRARDIARLVRGSESTVILLAHDPRRLEEAAALNMSLVLSGHTHGGQVVLPGVGAVAARKFPVIAGIGRRDNTSIFVSRGVGTVYVPYRLNCPPDVSVITLKTA